MQGSASLSYDSVREALAQQELFEDKTWQLSPLPFSLSAEEFAEIERIGQACVDFYRALETLYLKSAEGRKLFRNRAVQMPWVAEYLDRGKSEVVLRWNRRPEMKGFLPPVIRPDLLLTEDGFSLTELDAVPGGIGLTAFLNRLYEQAGCDVIGGEERMVDAYYASLSRLAPEEHHPLIVIVVSDESATYRPEMLWLAEELQRRGRRVFCVSPRDLIPLSGELFIDVEGNPEKIDVIYRFFELYDLENLPHLEFLLEALENGSVVMAPPIRSFHEEKLSLALFHHHLLQDFWKENLSSESREVLGRVLPLSWVVDPAPVPPAAVLVAPRAGGRNITDWRELAEASQKERNLILKISGFHETAEGAKSVLLGSDCSREEWREGIEQAVQMSSTHLHVLQEFRKPVRRKHPLYTDGGTVMSERQGRLRLCPYFFNLGTTVELAGVLATFCPPDKKIIHGMRDAALLPSCVEANIIPPK
ncbi:MAG: hypothetical protein WD490_00820 [Opitutales bacterium]